MCKRKGGKVMEAMLMFSKIKPFKTKKMNKRMTRRAIEALKNAPSAPIEQLRKEAVEFERLVINRRTAKLKE